MKKIFKRARPFAVSLIVGILVLGLTACSQSQQKRVSSDDEGKIRLFPAYTEEDDTRKWGFINDKGEFVIQPVYEGINCIKETNLAWVYVRGDSEGSLKTGIIDRISGNIILPLEYESLKNFSEGLAVVKDAEGQYKVIDEQGKVLFEIEKDFCDLFYEFHDGVVRFYINIQGPRSREARFGFLDKTGKVIIEPTLLDAENFTDGKALVVTAEGQNAIIDKKGNVLSILDFANCGGLSEGLLAFRDEATDMHGYANTNGECVLPPCFAEAYPFQNGVAIVGVSDREQGIVFGLINKEGKYIIKPEYRSIRYLGEGKYSVYKNVVDNAIPPGVLLGAIFNAQGQQLTEFSYCGYIPDYQNGYVSFCSEKETYFLDENGQPVEDLPRIPGLGELEIVGEDLVKFSMGDPYSGGDSIRYYNKAGKLIWRPNNLRKFADLLINDQFFESSWGSASSYPQIEGLADQEVQAKINKQIEEAVKENNKAAEQQEVTVESFTLNRYLDLLVVKYNTDIYFNSKGANTELRVRFNHINLQDGTFYQLRDLFRQDANYLSKITELIKRQIAEKKETVDEDEDYDVRMERFTGLKEEPCFEITEDRLKIYLDLGKTGDTYESSRYDMVEFAIDYSELADIIDTEGVLWQAFHRGRSL